MSLSPSAELVVWLVANGLSPSVPADLLARHHILTMEDLWVSANPCYQDAFAKIVPSLGLRARIHRLLLDSDAVAALASRAAATLFGNTMLLGGPSPHMGPAAIGELPSANHTSLVPLQHNPTTVPPTHKAEVVLPLKQSQVLHIYWDIESVVTVPKEVPDFMQRVVAKLIREGVVTSRANVKFNVVAQHEITERFANQLRAATVITVSNKHATSDKKIAEVADRKMESLIREKLEETTLQQVPAFMLITKDQDFMDIMMSVVRTGRHMYLVHRAPEQNTSQRTNFAQCTTQSWSWPEIFSDENVLENIVEPDAMSPGAESGGMTRATSEVAILLPSNPAEALQYIAASPHLKNVCETLAFGRDNIQKVDNLLETWYNKRIKFPDFMYASFYLKKEGSRRGICTKFNGAGDASVGICDTKEKYGKPCAFLHVCLFCDKQGHGWYSDCPAYLEYVGELDRLGLTEDQVDDIVDALTGKRMADPAELLQLEEVCSVSFDGAPKDSAPSTNLVEESVNARALERKVDQLADTAKFSVSNCIYREDLVKLLEHAPNLKEYIHTIATVVKRDQKAIAEVLKKWEANRVPLFSNHFAAYFVAKEQSFCCKMNGPGPSIGVGYGKCNHEERTGHVCQFEHACLLCGNGGHGWFDFNVCEMRVLIQRERAELGINMETLNEMIRIYQNDGKRIVVTQSYRDSPSVPVATPKAKTVATTPASPKNSRVPQTFPELWALVKPYPELTDFVRCLKYSTKEQLDQQRQYYIETGWNKSDITDDFAAYSRMRTNLNRKTDSSWRPCAYFSLRECKNGNSKCGYKHVCLLCEKTSHGYANCPVYDTIVDQLEECGISQRELKDAVAKMLCNT